jgi:futalosine hydrolase
MEGAAAALACRKARVRFIEVRGISNFVGPRRRGDWRIEEAVQGAARVALAVARAEVARAEVARAEVARAKVARAKVARAKVAPRSRSR